MRRPSRYHSSSAHAARQSGTPDPTGSGDTEKIKDADIFKLMKMLASVPDFRKEKGREYEPPFTLAVLLVALLPEWKITAKLPP
jgi:hypothetical protein